MANYETKTGSYTKNLGDGDVLEHILIDGEGQNVGINVHGAATVRNVAILNASNSPAPIHINVPEGKEARLEQVFVKGVDDNCVFVNEQCAGRVIIDRCYLGDAVEDGLYASPAGNPTHDSGKANPGGQGGVVEVLDSYCENCNDYGWRVGSEGSRVVGSVAKNCKIGFANLYALGKGALFKDCDALDCQYGIKHIDHDDRNVGQWAETVVTTLENVRVRAEQSLLVHSTASGRGTIKGTPQSDPNDLFPDGVPRTAKQAASGEVPVRHHVEIDGSNVSSDVDYELVGHASKTEPGEDANVGDGESRVDVRTWKGLVNGGSDDYYVFSESPPHITSLTLSGAQSDLEAIRVFLDGKDVTDIATLEPTDTSDTGDSGGSDSGGSDSGSGSEPTLPTFDELMNRMKGEQVVSELSMGTEQISVIVFKKE